jgi:hypothetical protein
MLSNLLRHGVDNDGDVLHEEEDNDDEGAAMVTWAVA